MKVSPSIENLVPYKPGKPIEETKRELGLTEVTKLASNENALGPSSKVVEAINKAALEIHRYPDPSCHLLAEKVSKHYNIESSKIAFGNGSNEVIDLLIRIFCEPQDNIVTSQAAFVAYKVCAQAARVNVVEAKMTEDLKFDLNEISSLCDQHNPKIVFIANPNNPTGTYLNESELFKFVESQKHKLDQLIVIDEAYFEFVRAKDAPNALDLLSNYKNVAVIRTFSKVFGLAGIRLGALFAHEYILDYYNRVRNPFNVNSLSQAGALAALDDEDYLKSSQDMVWSGLDYFYKELEGIGVNYWPSQANFVLIDVAQPAVAVYQELLKLGVILRPVNNYGFETLLRLSVGTAEENQKAIQALKIVLKK